MNIPETFYIALCVTILMLGVVYWFWTQIQYLQRKVNLLDNVVYEMKTLVSNLPGQGGSSAGPGHIPSFVAEQEYPVPKSNMVSNSDDDSSAAPYAPPPESVAGDIEAERVASELEFNDFSGASKDYNSPSDEQEIVTENTVLNDVVELQDDLRPGGLAVPSDEQPKKRSEQSSDAAIESPLNSMSIKELRRMAEANSIPGASEMRKRDLVRVLRNKVSNIINTNNEDSGVISLDTVEAPGSD